MNTRIKSTEFDFHLPVERIAQRPRPAEEQKLLVFDRQSHTIVHHLFSQLPRLLRAGDVVVVNNSRVIPAALRLANGTFILFTNPMSQSFMRTQVICPRKLDVGERLEFTSGVFIVREQESQPNLYLGDLLPNENLPSLQTFLQKHGSMPLPNYINRAPDDRDEQDFQTVFARHLGSIAAPTASLHFTREVIEELLAREIEVVELTLHIGHGTFRSFKTEYVDEHKMDKEEYHVSLSSLQRLGKALRENRRIIAVGTTSTRVLESIAPYIQHYETVEQDITASTDIFIYPPYSFKIISGLLTNFHYPKMPVMSLACAFCGLEELRRVYQAALELDYLFYSYGDAMLAL